MHLGDHETILDLGRGGMADLFVARPASGGDLAIVKVLRPPATDKPIAMFRDEARIGLLLDHPNVIRTFRIGEEAGRHFIVLELLLWPAWPQRVTAPRASPSRCRSHRDSRGW